MIDLHIHSRYSDGTLEVLEILEHADQLKLTTISVTDHENCKAYNELNNIDIKKYFSGRIIPGIELKSGYQNQVIDILGYDIDCTKMNNNLAECYGDASREKIQTKQLREFYEYGEKYGLVLTSMDSLVWDKSREWASIVFYEEMKKHIENESKLPGDLWQSFINFKRNYYNKKGAMFYIDRSKDYPPIDNIIEIIHKSGGLAFIAHIYEYAWIQDKLEFLKNITEKFDVDGVECYYNSFSKQQTDGLIKFCEANNLLMSGGSDYHGENRPEIKIGVGRGNLEVPDNIISGWVKD